MTFLNKDESVTLLLLPAMIRTLSNAVHEQKDQIVDLKKQILVLSQQISSVCESGYVPITLDEIIDPGAN